MSKTLILFLGNSLFSDDRIGLELGERLRQRLEERGYSVELAEKTGLALLDHLESRREVVIVDSIKTGKHPIGEVFSPSVEEFDSLSLFSPHYAGLPETIRLLEALELSMDCRIQIVAIEVEDPYTVSDTLSERLGEKLNDVLEKVYSNIILLTR